MKMLQTRAKKYLICFICFIIIFAIQTNYKNLKKDEVREPKEANKVTGWLKL